MKRHSGLAVLGVVIAIVIAVVAWWSSRDREIEPTEATATQHPDAAGTVATQVVPPEITVGPDLVPREVAPSTAGERAVATVRVFGRMPSAVSFRVSGAGDAIDGRVRFPAEDRTFSIDAMPIAHCDIAGFGADGTQWKRHFERPVTEAGDDWDLGTVDVVATPITVDLELNFTRDVVQALQPNDRVQLYATLYDDDAKPASIASHTFDVQKLLDATSPLQHSVETTVRDPSKPVRVVWSMTSWKGWFPVVLGIGNGERRQLVRLDLLPGTTIRGHVEWDDGERVPDVEVRCTTAALPLDQHTTGDDGSFCFVVGAGAKATLDLDVVPALIAKRPVPTHTAMAGDIVTLRRGPRLRYRLLGEDGRPLERFAVSTCSTHEARITHHPGGMFSELSWALERIGWIRFHVAPLESHTFLVPPNWIATPETVHDLRLADRLPTGSVDIVGDAAGERLKTRFLAVALVGEGEIEGMQVLSSAPRSWPWLVPDVPIGRYRVDFLGVGSARPSVRSPTSDMRPVVTVTANAVAQVTLPD